MARPKVVALRDEETRGRALGAADNLRALAEAGDVRGFVVLVLDGSGGLVEDYSWPDQYGLVGALTATAVRFVNEPDGG